MPLRAMSSRAAHTSLARVSSRRRAPRPAAMLRCADVAALVPFALTQGGYRRSDDYVKSDESIRSSRLPFERAAVPSRKLGAALVGDGEIERSPEEVHRAALTRETPPELLEDGVRLHENLKESAHGLGIVGRMHAIVGEADRVRDLDRNRPDLHRDSERIEHRDEVAVEVGDRARDEREASRPAVGAGDDEHVIDEVEEDLERPAPVGNRRSAEPA